MGADDQTVVLYGVVDRVEDEVAVLVLEGGQAAFLPRSALPRSAREGSGVRIQVRLAPNPWRARVRDALDGLEEEGR
ncbi:MAG: DUF3006 domain-containing protein [Armatimonadota bacterium]|nr:DUF3006 domain-containing protein [Armatimonadota bacterium]MDR5676401.1 DUF3006 domain-containing protein [Armatimonadota bacterium]MDR5690328.1 DUF3006 domain-containing protein [Armatimonadota bacterium]MDR7386573.1 DUF3006 domain-containing protein [Armatimonadota bacterium]MDR7389691.1 DUF3006 domain-containing protein [Armatimonadota bacterium]